MNINGLTTKQAQDKLKEFGPNKILKTWQVSFWSILIEEVTEPMILLLLVVGVAYSLWGKLEDAITIFIIIILLTLAEVYNEFRAKKAISSLTKIATPKTKALRDGKVAEVDSESIVPGDVLVLGQGTKIAADGKIVKSVGIQVDESALTGESFPNAKMVGDMVFAGTIVSFGEGLCQVESTGAKTRLGEISGALKAIKPPKTALQLAMKSLAGKLVYVALFFSLFIPFLGFLRHQDWGLMVLTGLSLSFATIPEELPIIITMVLGIGSYNLSKNKFLVKRLKAAETLGNATVIVTDKTGTITEGIMKIASVFPNEGAEVVRNALYASPDFQASPVDVAIKEKASSIGVDTTLPEAVRERNLGDGRKTRSIIRKTSKGQEIFMAGAPEEVLAGCSGVGPKAQEELDAQTKKGRRVIAFAAKTLQHGEDSLPFEAIEKNLSLIGLFAFEDSPRQGVKETIALAKNAGVRTIMVTGDHPQTAKYIASQVGIASENVATDDQLKTMSDEQLAQTLGGTSVFARSTPELKYRIVKALQQKGDVVAVTGDGINDVLALKGADIGIAMGKKGTDVAKEAAEVVLADDNYNTIAQGIFEGRAFFDNLQKGIKYYLSVKAALVLIFLLPIVLGISMPFAPIQIIVLELFMDLAASAGFVAEPKEKNIYTRSPRNPKESILGPRAIADILVKGLLLFACVSAVYLYCMYNPGFHGYAQTLAFSAWIIGHIALAFVSRSDKETLFSLGFFNNKVMDVWAVVAIGFLVLGIYLPTIGATLKLVFVEPLHLVYVAIVVVAIIGLLEIAKLFRR